MIRGRDHGSARSGVWRGSLCGGWWESGIGDKGRGEHRSRCFSLSPPHKPLTMLGSFIQQPPDAGGRLPPLQGAQAGDRVGAF